MLYIGKPLSRFVLAKLSVIVECPRNDPSTRAGLLGIFEIVRRGHFLQNARQ